MRTKEIDFTENVLDSRDIIARAEELQEQYDDLLAAVEDATNDLEGYLKTNSPEEDGDALEELKDTREEALLNLHEFNTFEKDELDLINEVIKQGEDCADWRYGESLIKEEYFQDYTEHLVDDCYELPKEMTSGEWPYRHMTIDWEAAAEELKQDYTEIDCGDNTYYIRS